MAVAAGRLGHVVAACLAMIGPRPVAAAPPPIVVLPVKVALGFLDRIGARRTGKFCLPAGSVRWADVALSPAAAQVAVVHGFRAAAVAATASDDATAASDARRVEGSIDAVTMDVCVAQRGVFLAAGGRRTTRLSGRLTIGWMVTDPRLGSAPHSFVTVEKLDADAADLVLQTEVERAITAGAADLARQLGMMTATP